MVGSATLLSKQFHEIELGQRTTKSADSGTHPCQGPTGLFPRFGFCALHIYSNLVTSEHWNSLLASVAWLVWSTSPPPRWKTETHDLSTLGTCISDSALIFLSNTPCGFPSQASFQICRPQSISSGFSHLAHPSKLSTLTGSIFSVATHCWIPCNLASAPINPLQWLFLLSLMA